MSHDEASDVLGAYALDAVDGDERTELEVHLASCPRCRAELDAMREVAAAMGNTVEPLPEGLWSAIASKLPERQEDIEAPPMPLLTPEGPEGPEGPAGPSPFRTSQEPRRRRGSRRVVRTAVGAIAGVAAVLAVVFGVSLVRANDRVSTLEAAAGHPAPVAAALRTPGHQVVDLKSASNAELAEFVMVPDGQGYLVSSKLPTLAGDQTYQLWGIVGNLPISLGVLGHAPSQAAFTMAGSRRPSRLTITAEPAGGTVVPTGPVVATGTV